MRRASSDNRAACPFKRLRGVLRRRIDVCAAAKILIGALAVSLVGCADMGQKEQIGGVLGGPLGGIGGAQIGRGQGRTAAIIGGTLLGAIVGSQVGRSSIAPTR